MTKDKLIYALGKTLYALESISDDATIKPIFDECIKILVEAKKDQEFKEDLSNGLGICPLCNKKSLEDQFNGIKCINKNCGFSESL